MIKPIRHRWIIAFEIFLLCMLPAVCAFTVYYTKIEANSQIKKHSLIADVAISFALEKNKEMEKLTRFTESLIGNKSASLNYLAKKYFECRIETDNLTEQLAKSQESSLYYQSLIYGFPFIDKAYEAIKDKEYDKISYNCVDFSSTALDAIKSMGYQGYIKVVKINCSASPDSNSCDDSSRHAIVILSLPLEVTQFVMPITPDLFNYYGLNNGDW